MIRNYYNFASVAAYSDPAVSYEVRGNRRYDKFFFSGEEDFEVVMYVNGAKVVTIYSDRSARHAIYPYSLELGGGDVLKIQMRNLGDKVCDLFVQFEETE